MKLMLRLKTLTLLTIFSIELYAQSSVDFNNIVDSLYSVFNDPGKPGLAISIVKQGEIVYQKCFGLADLEHQIPITDSTQFALASVSKQFTGYGIAKLICEGRLNPNDELSTYLKNENALWDSVQIRNLIHHTSGIWDWPYLFIASGHTFNDVIAHHSIYNLIKSQSKLNFPTGSDFQYASSNYVLLGELITNLTDTGYCDWITHNVFKPAGMLNTVFQSNYSDLIQNRAHGYLLENVNYLRTSNNISPLGTGSIYSNLTDMTIWAKFVLSEYSSKKQVTIQMFEVDTLNNGDNVPYAYGLMKMGENCYWHDGVFQGFRNVTILYPEQNVGLVLLSNSGSNYIMRSAFAVAKMFLKDSVPEKEIMNFRKQFGQESKLKNDIVNFEYHQNLDDFNGVFLNNEILLTYRICEENDSLFAKNSVERILLTPIEGELDKFYSSKLLLGDFFFERDENGQIKEFCIKQRRGNIIRFRKIEVN